MSQSPAPQRVLVTAGAAGIGRAIADAFLERGAEVHICDIDQAAIDRTLAEQPKLTASLADVGDPAAVDAMFAEMNARWDGLDVLVNNAGVGGPRGPLESVEDADWDACVRVNLNGAFYCMKRAIPAMKRRRSGAIINISTSSARTGLINRTAYVASKAGMIALTENAARELGPFDIRCNAILPGIIDNERGQMLIRRFGEERGLDPEAAKTEFLQFVSMRTMIDMREVAAAAVFLASDDARHITAQSLRVCGNVEWEG
jgi:NAD(P)-dependent dehydrogenase (short-subunit alcohol dehydrogenase family)